MTGRQDSRAVLECNTDNFIAKITRKAHFILIVVTNKLFGLICPAVDTSPTVLVFISSVQYIIFELL
jgi:hypothetical protein